MRQRVDFDDFVSVLVDGEGWSEIEPETFVVRSGRVKQEGSDTVRLEWVAHWKTPDGKIMRIPLRRISLARLR